MKKVNLFVPLLGLFVIFNGSLLAQDASSTLENDTDFSKTIQSLQDYFSIPGLAVLVKRNDTVIYEEYLGFSDCEAQIPVGPNTTFPIASLTKIFTGITTMHLVETNRLDLRTSMNDFYENRPFENSVNVAQVLSHTSQGIPPGVAFYYSSRFGALKKVLEESSNASLEQLMDSLILSPLNLRHTYPLKDSLYLSNRKEIMAKPYFLEDGTQPGFIDYGFSTAAGMVSTVRDLSKLDSALDQNLLISKDSKKQLTEPFQPGLPYGLGIFSETFAGKKLIWGYGQYDCYSSLWLKVPEEQLTFLLMGNNNLLSDPARLIYGHVPSSLFALAFLQHFVFDEETDLALSTKKTLRREQLRSEALAASFMARYRIEEFDKSKQRLESLFAEFPDYNQYGDLSLLHNLLFLKTVASYRDLGPFTDFDDQILEIGSVLLEKDPYNPYALYYLGNFQDMSGQSEKAAEYYIRITEAENFSTNWYTREAQSWLDAHTKKQ
ncbi:MAG: serine hydrolase [Bacteroidota bacterium]